MYSHDQEWGLWCFVQLSCWRLSTRVQCLTVTQSLLQVKLGLEEEKQRWEEEEFNVSDIVPDLTKLWYVV